jgi:hypothetical protein
MRATETRSQTAEPSAQHGRTALVSPAPVTCRGVRNTVLRRRRPCADAAHCARQCIANHGDRVQSAHQQERRQERVSPPTGHALRPAYLDLPHHTLADVAPVP